MEESELHGWEIASLTVATETAGVHSAQETLLLTDKP